MGTSGAYKGSSGWKSVRDQTQEWLSSRAGGGEGSSALAGIIDKLGDRLGGAGAGGAGREGAAAAGGRVLGGASDVSTGNTGTVGELGLDPGELAGLSRYQQVQRIVDAAIPPGGDVQESELRAAAASVVTWLVSEEVPPTPVEVVGRWVVEYVWEVWITETGMLLEEYSAAGHDRSLAEQEMHAALEATVSTRALPDDRPLTSADFTAAINSALGSLRRISGDEQ